MMGTRKRDLDVMFLFNSFEPADILGVIASLNHDISATGLEFQLVFHDERTGEWLFASSTQTIRVRHGARPLAAEPYRRACNSSYTRAMIPDAPERVERHASFLGFTVTCGPRDRVQKPSPSLADFSAAVDIAVILAMKFMNLREPEIVHWGQSNQLVLPRHIAATCDMNSCYPLLIHPIFYSHDRSPGEVPSIGFHTLGASDLLGQEIEMSEVRVPFPETLNLMFAFVALCEVRGAVMADGETFGNDRDLRVRVQHVMDAGPHRRLRLTVEHHAAYGIGAPLPRPVPVAVPVTRQPVLVASEKAAAWSEMPVRRAPIMIVPGDPPSARSNVISVTRERLVSQSEEQGSGKPGLRGFIHRISNRVH